MGPVTRFFAGFLLLVVWAVPVRAGEVEDLAAQAMVLSGTRDTLVDLGKSLDAQFASDPRVKKLSKTRRSELKEILKSSLDGRRMAEELTALLAGSGDVPRLRASVSAMESPVFQKVTQVMVRESLKATDEVVSKYVAGFEKHPPDPARIQLIQRLEAATDGAAVIADMRYEVAAYLLEQAQVPDREGKLAELQAQVAGPAQEEYLARSLFATRQVSMSDLEAYVSAHENDAMGWLARVIGYGVKDLIVASSARMLSAIAAASESKRK
jgi:hypothetical protein